MSDICGYEYVPEEGWRPMTGTPNPCDTCGAIHAETYDCDPDPCDDGDCPGCELTDQAWADCGANYPPNGEGEVFTLVRA